MAATYIPLATQTLSSAVSSVTFSGIPQTYTDLVIVANLGKSLTGSSVEFRFNADGGSNYSITELYGNGTSAASARASNLTYGQVAYDVVPGSGITSNFLLNIMNYSNTTTNKTTISRNNSMDTTYSGAAAIVNLWRSTAAINSITFTSSGGATFTTGSTFSLYGIASAALSAKATGGNIVTTDGTYWYHTFTESGTFTPSTSLSADYLIVAGGGGAGGTNTTVGGGGWFGGGGGAGGYRTSIGGSQMSLVSTAYTVTVGAGGAGGTSGSSANPGSAGSNSVFNAITSTGGGYGGAGYSGTINGGNGGSGGGAGGQTGASTGGTGISGQGFDGGNTAGGGTGYGGGGGGSSSVGGAATSGANVSGGTGTTTTISGSSVTYAAGGKGGSNNTTGAAGTVNTGNGGDRGNGVTSGNGFAGGSGIVIVRYAV